MTLKNPGRTKPFPYQDFLWIRQFLPTFKPFETILGTKKANIWRFAPILLQFNLIIVKISCTAHCPEICDTLRNVEINVEECRVLSNVVEVLLGAFGRFFCVGRLLMVLTLRQIGCKEYPTFWKGVLGQMYQPIIGKFLTKNGLMFDHICNPH